jgi:hypothetical protein
MRIKSPFTLVVLLGLIGLGAGTAPATIGPVESPPFVPPDGSTWRAVELRNGVEERCSDGAGAAAPWRGLEAGAELTAGASIRSNKRARATLIRDGRILQLEPASRVELPRERDRKPLVHQYGTAIYNVERRGRERLRVLTDRLMVESREALFALTVTDEHTTLTVRNGQADAIVQRSGETHRLRAGETLRVGGEREAEVESVSPAELDPANPAALRSDTWRLALEQEERIDRALARLEPRLAAYRYVTERDGYAGLQDLEYVLERKLESAKRDGTLIEGSTISGVREQDDFPADDAAPGSRP